MSKSVRVPLVPAWFSASIDSYEKNCVVRALPATHPGIGPALLRALCILVTAAGEGPEAPNALVAYDYLKVLRTNNRKARGRLVTPVGLYC